MNIKTKMLYKSVLLLAPLLAICFGCSCLRITQRQAYNQAEIGKIGLFLKNYSRI